ncbi:MAG: heavy-metal-associated domain-containing protein [Actinomycetota bacterium]|nr:heavy-metal-associated domain-containing protein [Actinomycetota bacterium]
MGAIAEQQTYLVEGMSCDHCRVAVADEVGLVPGVESVDVDLESRLVTVRGQGISGQAVLEAIAEAGYEVREPAS